MGEAKRRRENAKPTVYHHTSILRTNLIWMSGVIQVEGAGAPAIHPYLGEIKTGISLRRKMVDFPPVAWFTTRLDVPKCLLASSLYFVNNETGETKKMEIDTQLSNAISLNRFALGFPIEEIGVTPWPEYFGYSTPEGCELNDTARAVGDDPNDWYISEAPVDMLCVSEIYASREKLKPKLERTSNYINDVKRLVALCRENKTAYIPPAWLSQSEVALLTQHLGVPTPNI